ncbi:hypothetical protein [Flavobacterium aquicola]|uniref:Uncharacterized protein n=1 Tax=Flavobacterium aquicola TaxID=1682742 RepID=A0A3E0E5G4_9FLAO|nr:hypothetical protein [Flavobacterium aquicola]REG92993.1 hypothetical protein C8P67_11494 [Flavobacterium aquicola]
MEINLNNISVIYPNETNPQPRKVNFTADGEFLSINILDDTKDSIGISLEKQEVELLIDTLQLILKHNLIEELA